MERQSELALLLVVVVASLAYAVFVLRALVLDVFDPYEFVPVTRLSDLCADRFAGFNKLLIAVQYEKWSRVLERTTRLDALALVCPFWVAMLLYPVLIQKAKEPLHDVSFVISALLSVLPSTAVAGVGYKLRAMKTELLR